MTVSAKWGDLLPRILSALVLVALGGFALMSGGLIFKLFVLALVAVMHWEMARMLSPESASSAMVSAVLAIGGLSLAIWVDGPMLALGLLLIGALVQIALYQRFVKRGVLFSLAILACGFYLIALRDLYGITMTLWLISVVVMTDIAGYFAGRIIGGPRFWPRFSPKKTWSGAIGGWIAAAVFTYVFVEAYDIRYMDEWIIALAVLLSFASQMGDIAQSALKRACDIKDSSNLIPGHGGFFDRFDGVIGATVMFGLFAPWLM